MSLKTPFAIFTLLTLGLAAQADDEPLQACAGITDDTARLSCYDRVVQAPPAPGPVEAPQADAAPDAPPPEPQPAPAATPAATAAQSPAEAADPTDQFGIVRRDYEGELKQISAVAVKVERRPNGGLVVTLDNGQVWAQKYAERLRVEVGDTVIIKRGSISGFRMIGRGNRASQVRRIK